MFEHIGSLIYIVLALIFVRSFVDLALEDLDYGLGRKRCTVANSRGQVFQQYLFRISMSIVFGLLAYMNWK